MPDPTPVPPPTSGYVVDAENVAEMARLTRQARMLSEHLGLYPQQLALAQSSHILDIGCGPGEWALEIAQRFPGSRVTGIDISDLMITYARSTAESLHIANVQFQVLDARQPLALPDASFDLVNARFIVGFMSTSRWPQLIGECFRLLRPGGIFCTCEPESLGTTTSPSLAQYNLLITQATRWAGQCFAPQGEQYGICAVQHRLLQEAGFQHIQQEASIINYSYRVAIIFATQPSERWTEPFLILPILTGCSCLRPINRINIYRATDPGTGRIELNTHSSNLARKVEWQ